MISYLCSLKCSHRPNYTSTIVDELSKALCIYATFLVDNNTGLLVTGFQEALECLYL